MFRAFKRLTECASRGFSENNFEYLERLKSQPIPAIRSKKLLNTPKKKPKKPVKVPNPLKLEKQKRRKQRKEAEKEVDELVKKLVRYSTPKK